MTTLTLIALALIVAAPSAAKIPAHKQAWQWKYQVWMPKHWQNLAACESGSRPPNWQHDSGTYVGAFGFYIGSWRQYRYAGYPARASQATSWQQWRVALRIAARFGIASPWGCWRGSQHAWVRNGLPERGVYR